MGASSGGILKIKRYPKKYFLNITGQHWVILQGKSDKGKRADVFIPLAVRRHSVVKHDIFVEKLNISNKTKDCRSC